MKSAPGTFHMHLVSDSTGETLRAISKAVVVQYPQVRATEHVHPLVRNERQLTRVVAEIEAMPGIVLYTLVNRELGKLLEQHCQTLKIPCVPVLDPILTVFQSYLGAPQTPTVGGQHVLDAAYFRRIDALNFTLMHDDGALPANLDDADIVLLGVSRTSKTPTSIYLANRGYKTTNLPLVPGIALPEQFYRPTKAFIIGLTASPERIAQIRRNRILSMGGAELGDYVDRERIAEELASSRKLCTDHGWPMIDVSRRSIEETAAAIIQLYDHHIEGGTAATAEEENG
ncbi:MAG: pyruvate, water dikinase regulatory protein [Hyphomicrobiaceae bacterium]